MTVVRKLAQIGGVFLVSGGVRAVVCWRPFSITSFNMARRIRDQGLVLASVLDGGANIGQFARAIYETFAGVKVVSFEPLPDVADALRRNMSGCSSWSMYECALGDRDGSIEFFRNELTVASSALSIHGNQVKAFPETARSSTMRVPLRTLDALLVDVELPKPCLLKLDLQGYEDFALRGAIETLKRCDHVLVETALKPFYEGECLFEDIYDFLRGAGFRFVRPIDVLHDPKGEIVQMDALFTRVGDQVQSS